MIRPNVKVICDIDNMPRRYQKIVLPSYIRSRLGYKAIHPKTSQPVKMDGDIAHFLTTDARYCNYFEIVEEDGGQNENERTDSALGDVGEVQILPAAVKSEVGKDEKPTKKKAAAKKKPAKKPAKKKADNNA